MEASEPEVEDADVAVGEGGGDLVAVAVPADLEDPAGAGAEGPHDPPLLERPDVEALVDRAAGQELAVRAEGDGVHRRAAAARKRTVQIQGDRERENRLVH